jgi:hypothetical protein
MGVNPSDRFKSLVQHEVGAHSSNGSFYVPGILPKTACKHPVDKTAKFVAFS